MEIIKVVFVIIGTFVGAGLASGQEVYSFFYINGIKGIIGILISSILIGIITYKVLKIVTKKNINNYNEFLKFYIRNNKLKKYTNSLINIFMLISFYIMIAGFGGYLKQEFNLNSLIGSIIFAIICFIILKTDVKGVIKANEILIPILIIIIILIGVINFKYIDIKNINNYFENRISYNWLIKSILYASYNSILLIPILISMKKYIFNQKHIKKISIIVTIIISILLITIYLLLINIDISNLEMPAVYAINKICPYLKNIYGITILIAIFTTAISVGISFLQNTCKTQKDFNIKCILICITAVLFSQIGFSNLVNILYPVLGGLGLIQIIQILRK